MRSGAAGGDWRLGSNSAAAWYSDPVPAMQPKKSHALRSARGRPGGQVRAAAEEPTAPAWVHDRKVEDLPSGSRQGY